MKIRYILLLGLCVMSFYISDKLLLYVEGFSPIMKSIKELNYEPVLPVDAIIDDNTIIPGIKGKKINERESYLKMNEFGAFNINFLQYDYQKPNISLEDNLDKIIIGTTKKTEISIITQSEKISSYLNEKKVIHSRVISKSIDLNDLEYINGAKLTNDYNEINRLLNKYKKNKNICIYHINDLNLCLDNKSYIIKPTNYISNKNLVTELNKLVKGGFVMLEDNLNNNQIDAILNQIKKDNLTIVKLSEIIKE